MGVQKESLVSHAQNINAQKSIKMFLKELAVFTNLLYFFIFVLMRNSKQIAESAPSRLI
jgi:hypothetical protein